LIRQLLSLAVISDFSIVNHSNTVCLEPKIATYSVDTTKSNNILFIFQLNFKHEVKQYVVPAP